MMPIQLLVHKFEALTQARLFKGLLLLLAAALLAVVYDLRNFKNMATQEAMDSAQLARNLAEGRGFTTQFIRPFSLYLLNRKNAASTSGTNTLKFQSGVPDISNAPIYPLALAGFMKLANFHFHISTKDERAKPFWGDSRSFRRYQPDFLITLFNQVLMILVVLLAFLWARKVFDRVVAWSSAALMLGTESLWQFSVSGLSTLLVMLIFMVLVWCLTLLEIEAREAKWGRHGAILLAAVAGVIVGIGALTRYSFACLILPVLFFVFVASGPRRVNFCLVALLAFTLTLTPWLVRNYQLSGAPLGTATYSLLADTGMFPGYELERSLDPDVRFLPKLILSKLFTNLHAIRQGNLFNLGMGWGTALFLTGFLIAFRNLTLVRVRYFVIFCLGVLIAAQALGRTHLSVDSPSINSENLLVILLPVVLIYAVGFFWMLLERIQLKPVELRVAGGVVGLVSCLSLLLSLIKPEASTVTYPPYYPPLIQQTASWMKPDELMMSDVPWAVAWYGGQPCIWLTLNASMTGGNSLHAETLPALSLAFKPIHALYLTPLTTDSRLLSDCLRSPETSWGQFVMRCVARQEAPEEFSLREMPGGFLPEQFFLSDTRRWQEDATMPAQRELDPALMPTGVGGKKSAPLKINLRRRDF